jgi:bacterioferritin B
MLGSRAVPSQAFVDALTEQIGEEFAASQQYVAIAVHYDAETLPRLAAFFYRQAIEERNHAMMMIQYLLDAGVEARVPGVSAPQGSFDDIVAPVALALEQERRVSDQVTNLASIARGEGDYASEQFMSWFIKEQVEEIASMNDLLTTVRRSADNPLRVEEYLAREKSGDATEPAGAPEAAGGAL